MIVHNTLTAALDANRSNDRSITYVEGADNERVLPFAELFERALGILYHLQQLGMERGDKLIIFLNDNEQFIDAFWACLYGGLIPVPVAVGISDEHRHKLLRIAAKLGQPYLYSNAKILDRLETFVAAHGFESGFARLRERTFLTDDLEDISRRGKRIEPSPDDLAFIQFSSGSTSEPKGIVLTHRNILANIDGVATAAQITDQDVSLSWMPLTHDMGLIGLHLTMLVSNISQILMPTDLFIRRPALWLQVAAQKGATILCSPNFGYKHLLKVFNPDKLSGLDLSAVRLIFNGAEPISVALCNDFLDDMAAFSLKRTSMCPVYGLAEATLAVTFPEPETLFKSIHVDRSTLGVGQKIKRIESEHADALGLACVGRPIPQCEVRIAGNEDETLPDDVVGHIQIRGDSVTNGYYEDHKANSETFASGSWLKTGDLGFFHQDELYITGRSKEIIFVNGQNYYPHDLEAIAHEAGGMELGKVAIAGHWSEELRMDELLVFILHRGDLGKFVDVETEVARLINRHTGLEVTHVIPVRRIPKTTSGKIQRRLLLKAYEDGEFNEDLEALRQLRSETKGEAPVTLSDIENKLKSICEAALPGKRIDVNDNLFEVGTSSLVLIQIHESIDEAYPELVDITELFDYPTIAELASHLESKLTQSSAA